METKIVTPTIEEVGQMPIAALRKLAAKLKINKTEIRTEEELRAHIGSKIQGVTVWIASEVDVQENEVEETGPEEIIDETPAKGQKGVRLEITEEMQAILDNAGIKKADKFRKLYELGVSTSQMAEMTASHYSFVFGVVKKLKEAAKEVVAA